jgi:uncharacterized protein involved in exopolysaccharide biosynthesis
VAAQADRDLALQKVNEVELALSQTRARIRATKAHVHALESELASAPPRLNTQQKDADNSVLLQQLKSTLLNLQLKRTGLLANYKPDYPPVQELDAEIAQAQAAIDREIKAPVRENTTDQNPTYEWLVGELAKDKADLPSLSATEFSTERAVEAYRQRIRELDEKGIVDQDLVRAVKAEEDNYLLYLKKQEEARISDQLDQRRISNIVVAEAAAVPVVPTYSRSLIFLLGIPLGMLVSIGAALLSDYMTSSFHSPDEVKEFLQLPVLAALPEDVQVSDR